MLIAARPPQLPSGCTLIPLTNKLFANESTKQLFKISEFQKSACFLGDSLSQPRLLTFTIYDPIFLAIQKCWSLQPPSPVSITSFLDSQQLHLLPYLQASFSKICQTFQRGSSIFYKPSFDKIMQFVQARYKRLVEVCKQKGVSLKKLGLDVRNAPPINPVVEGILRQDLDEVFIQELKRRFPAKVEMEVERGVTEDNYVQEVEIKKKKSVTKVETKREKEFRHQKMTNHSLMAFFKTDKKEDKTPEKGSG